MRFVLGALAVAMVAGVAFVQPAEARCFWNGYAMECYGSSFYQPYRFEQPLVRHHVYSEWDRY